MANVFLLAYECLIETNPDKKIVLSKQSAESILSGHAELNTQMFTDIKAGRPEKPVLITPKDLVKRNLLNLEGQAAMIHSFAHIEFNAINLAWDLICRFQDMPRTFYADWAQVALEETRHFNLLRDKLKDMDYDYGDFPAHAGLWKIAEETRHDILLRLAVVPRIMEARGLDVTPDLINRFKEIKDDKTVSILEVILEEEIGHVRIGSKWFHYVCEKNKQDPDLTFKKILDQYMPATTKKLNKAARIKAGFSQSELDYMLSC